MHKENWQEYSYAASCSVSDRVLFQCLKDNPNIKNVFLCFDNDEAGRNAYLDLAREFSGRICDFSDNYNGHKDLNDYLCDKPMSQSEKPIKEKKQVQSARRMMQPPKKKGGFHL